jgi:hypothetical protein
VSELEDCLQYSRCELFLLEVGSLWHGAVRESRGKGISAVESYYQATTNWDCNRLRRPSVSYSDL